MTDNSYLRYPSTRYRERTMGSGEGEITVDDFEARLAELVEQSRAELLNQGSHGSEGCRYCTSCMFCRSCEYCYRCNYCERCQGCSQCTRCQSCSDCHSCAYCVDCERCTGSSFLIRSVDCTDCTYCFGCVGLSKRDFHILNEPYDRTTYFRITEKLKRALRIS
jgi:hypothetical protein